MKIEVRSVIAVENSEDEYLGEFCEDKEITVYTTFGMVYSGKISKITQKCMNINDEAYGNITVEYSDIERIEE